MIELIIIIIVLAYLSFLSSNTFKFSDDKYKIYTYIPDEYQLKMKLVKYDEITDSIVNYPIIIKPVYCNGLGTNVRLLLNKDDLIEYINNIDKDEMYIIQEYYKCSYEFGLLYEKMPLMNGEIISLTLKNKHNSDYKLVCNTVALDGTNCENKNYLITDKLRQSIRKVADSIPGFYVGRFDICSDNFEDLKNGKFKIFEVNGNMGFDLNNLFDDVSISIKNIIGGIKFINWMLRRILIGFVNILLLRVNILDRIKNISKQYYYYKKCNNNEWLFQPSSA